MLLVWLVAACFLVLEDLSFAEEPGSVITLQVQNDFFGGDTDRHFTHGTRIEWLTRPLEWITNAADKLPWFSAERALSSPEDALKGRASFCIGQNIYTPEDTAATQLIPEDRPYAGWLYLGFGLVAKQGSHRYDKLELEIGMVGPYSFAEDVQTYWHSLFGLRVPQGWDNQLNNELGIALHYEQARRFARRDVMFGLKFDALPYFGGSLGNVYTCAAAGFTLRLGSRLDDDFGPPRIRPSLPGSCYFRPARGYSWYLFAGGEGRVILRDIFLDGNTFSDSHSVDKKPFVGDVQAGLVVHWNRFRLAYTQIFRTKEFEGQDSADIYGALSISHHF